MKCKVCRGACCETFTAEIYMHPPNRDAQTWLELHATVKDFGPKLTFECRCTKLTSEGSCSIYEDRPIICELFIRGGKECLETVRTRRTAKEYELIRDEGDPLTIHSGEASMSSEFDKFNKEVHDLISRISDMEDKDEAIELLQEVSSMADTARDEIEQEQDQEDEVEDAEADDDEEELEQEPNPGKAS